MLQSQLMVYRAKKEGIRIRLFTSLSLIRYAPCSASVADR